MATSLEAELVDALSRFELDAIAPRLAPEFRRWLNFGGEQTAEEMLAVLAMERRIVARSTVEVRGRATTDSGFVLQLTIAGETVAGRSFEVPVCLVVTVRDEQIVRMDEYASLHHAQPLLDELFGSG